MSLTSFKVALRERIAGVTAQTGAHRCMTDHTALRVGTTRAWTRISTLSIDTGQVARTLAVARALGPTVRRRANKIGQTGAGWFLVDGLEHGIRTTLAGSAGVFRWRARSCEYQFIMILFRGRSQGHRYKTVLTDEFASSEGITGETGRATAHRIVIHNLAEGLQATGARAGVDALLVVAGLIPRTI